MREIKFRAWDKKLKKMVFTGFHVIGEVTCFELIYQHCYETKGDDPTFGRLKDIELMQYTNLKDSKDVEIYEGDVLENIKGHRFVMEYGGLAFGCRGLTPYANGFVEFSYDTITNPKITKMSELEIIGDIYENPELLEANDGI